jgi:hypothetical protein
MSSHRDKLATPSVTGAVAIKPPTAAQGRMAALRAAWMAHTIKRALTAVGSASDADYGAFGWERGDLLVRLQWLRDEIERCVAKRPPAMVTLARTSTCRTISAARPWPR